MRASVIPFFTRSLRMDTRSWKGYAIRGGMLLILLLYLTMFQSVGAAFGAPGLRLFECITGVTAFLICLGGPAFFATVITEEKELMTLGLLKMTGLRSVSILLGTSTSELISAVALLLAQVPFTVLAVTLGGVGLNQVSASYAALLAHLFFVSNLGLLCSVVSRRSSRAAFLSIVLLFGFFCGPPLGKGILSGMLSEKWIAKGGTVDVVFSAAFDWLTRASVFTRLGEVLSTGFSGGAAGFQVLSNLAMGLALFGLAWAAFERFTRWTEPGPGRTPLLWRVRGLRFLRPERAWGNALAWKDFHFMAGGKAGLLGRLLLLGVVVGVIGIISHEADGREWTRDWGDATMFAMLAAAFIELVVWCGRVFALEQHGHTLSSLLVLPVSTRRMAYSKAAGGLLGLVPTVVWFLFGACLSPEHFSDALGTMVAEAGFWFGVADVVFFFHLAVFFSILFRRGGLLLAFAAWIFGSQFVMTFMFMLIFSPAGPEFGLVALAICLCVLAGVLHWATLKRLEALGGR